MIPYPYSSAIVLDDARYIAYGGETGTSTSAMRQAAYFIAEKEMTQHLGTFLKPTVVTGTHVYPSYGEKVVLEYSYVQSVNGVTFISYDGGTSCTTSSTTGCGLILDGYFGYIWVTPTGSCFSPCSSLISPPFLAKVSYTAGLHSGTCDQADMLLALTILADLTLKEITDPGALEGGGGDPAVLSWSSLMHAENRKPTEYVATIFGSSPRALKAAKLVEGFRKRRGLRL